MGAKKQSRHVLSILGFLAVYVGFGFLFALDRSEMSHALHEVFRSKALTAGQAPGARRILLVGGSNVIWGFRSQLVEDETGIPTFNLGLMHEAYDAAAMRRLALSVTREGDVLVYSSISFWNARVPEPDKAQEILQLAGVATEARTSYRKWLSPLERFWLPYPQQSTIISSLPTLYRRYIQQERSAVLLDLNEKGDIKSCSKVAPALPTTFHDPPPHESFLQSLEDFQESLQARGASLVLTLPPTLISPGERQLWLDAYAPFLSTLRERFTVETPTIKEAVFTEEWQTCDTAFHIGDELAADRSQALARFLKDRVLPPRLGDGKEDS